MVFLEIEYKQFVQNMFAGRLGLEPWTVKQGLADSLLLSDVNSKRLVRLNQNEHVKAKR